MMWRSHRNSPVGTAEKARSKHVPRFRPSEIPRLMGRLWISFRLAFDEWSRHDGYLLSAALAYYASLSLFPICLVLIAGLGQLSNFSVSLEDQQAQLLAAVERNSSPWLATQLQSLLSGIKANAGIGGPIGLISLLLTAIGVFVQLDNSFTRIWGVPPNHEKGIIAALHTALYDRLVAFLMLLAVGGLVMVVFVLNMVLAALRPFVLQWTGGAQLWHIVQIAATLGLNVVLFTLLYKTLPKRPVSWRAAVLGGFFTAGTWHFGQWVLASFVISDKYSAYGIIGTFLAVMLWIYYASALLFFGAELVRALDSLEPGPSWSPPNQRKQSLP